MSYCCVYLEFKHAIRYLGNAKVLGFNSIFRKKCGRICGKEPDDGVLAQVLRLHFKPTTFPANLCHFF